MAVYTEVDDESLSAFLGRYALGPAINFQGIEAGVENTNYFLETGKGKFVLTLFEKRTPGRDLPFFINLMAHLSANRFPCPKPVTRKDGGVLGTLAGRKAVILTWLSGAPVMAPTPKHCFAAGALCADMHLALEGFGEPRSNPFGLPGLTEIHRKIKNPLAERSAHLEKLAHEEIQWQNRQDFENLPRGIIHADLFPDNVFFQSGEASGVIDFYFSAEGPLAFDLAIMADSWCFDHKGRFLADHFAELLAGYESKRPLIKEERDMFPALLRLGALRFLLTRAEDWLNPDRAVLGIVKDPEQFGKILSFHHSRRHIEDYS